MRLKKQEHQDILNIREADIYCAASKNGLATRKPAYLERLKEIAMSWKKDNTVQNLSEDEFAGGIANLTREQVIASGWDVNDKDGASWFIANYVDVAIMARNDFKNKYDILFKKAFDIYFEL